MLVVIIAIILGIVSISKDLSANLETGVFKSIIVLQVKCYVQLNMVS